MNEFADEATYRLSRQVDMEGQPKPGADYHAGLGRNAHARSDGAGRLVGR